MLTGATAGRWPAAGTDSGARRTPLRSRRDGARPARARRLGGRRRSERGIDRAVRGLRRPRTRPTDLTWPVSRPAGLDLATRVQDRGSLTVASTLHPPTAPSELRLGLQDFDLAPWARLTPLTAELTGVAEADLRIRELSASGCRRESRG